MTPPTGVTHGDQTLAALDAAAAEDIADIRLFGRRVVLVNRGEWIQQILVDQAAKFQKGPLLSVVARPLLGNGLLTSDNALNRQQRKFLSPPFAHRRVSDYAAVVTDYTTRVASQWKVGDNRDICADMLSITVGVIGRILLSEDLIGEASSVGDALSVLMRFAVDVQQKPMDAFRAVPRALVALRSMTGRVNRAIAAHRGLADGATASTDLLSRLLSARSGSDSTLTMSENLVRDEAVTLFVAGAETVAMALCWSLYALAVHPHMADRLRDEVNSVIGDRPPTVDDLPKLPYALQVFKEAMRLWPPGYIVARQALSDIALGPRIIMRGQVVLISPYVQHRRPEFYPDPLRFDPDRWTNPDAERILGSRYAYMPFGDGPRVCIGGHFALMEGHLALVGISQAARFALPVGASPAQTEPLFTLRPRRGLSLQVRPVSERAPLSTRVGESGMPVDVGW